MTYIDVSLSLNSSEADGCEIYQFPSPAQETCACTPDLVALNDKCLSFWSRSDLLYFNCKNAADSGRKYYEADAHFCEKQSIHKHAHILEKYMEL